MVSTAPNHQNTAALLLAGGQGRRIGGKKPAVIYRGRSLLDWSCDIMSAIPITAERKFISVGSHKDLIIKDSLSGSFNPIADIEPNQGPLGGIISALESPHSHGAEWLLTLPVDMPNLPLDLCSKLASAHRPGCRIIRAASAERSFPTIALMATDLTTELRTYINQGGRKIFDFQNRFVVIERVFLSPSESLNVNSLEDL